MGRTALLLKVIVVFVLKKLSFCSEHVVNNEYIFLSLPGVVANPFPIRIQEPFVWVCILNVFWGLLAPCGFPGRKPWLGDVLRSSTWPHCSQMFATSFQISIDTDCFFGRTHINAHLEILEGIKVQNNYSFNYCFTVHQKQSYGCFWNLTSNGESA